MMYPSANISCGTQNTEKEYIYVKCTNTNTTTKPHIHSYIIYLELQKSNSPPWYYLAKQILVELPYDMTTLMFMLLRRYIVIVTTTLSMQLYRFGSGKGTKTYVLCNLIFLLCYKNMSALSPILTALNIANQQVTYDLLVQLLWKWFSFYEEKWFYGWNWFSRINS